MCVIDKDKHILTEKNTIMNLTQDEGFTATSSKIVHLISFNQKQAAFSLQPERLALDLWFLTFPPIVIHISETICTNMHFV